MRKRLRAAVALSVVAGALTFDAGPAPAQTPAPELLPDLQGLPAEDLRIQTGAGVRNLRLSTTIANGGVGAFEIYPVGGTDCDGDGNAANDRVAYQRVFRDVDGNGFFERAADTDSASYPAGCMIYHPAHAHWHFEDFASYQLRIPATGEVVASTTKVSFCLLDFWPFDAGLFGHPSDEHYDTCSEDDTEGISVGWADTYESHLAGQTIDIRHLSDGEYCLAVTGDPSDIVHETNEVNNEAQTLIGLFGNSVTTAGGPCVARAVSSQTGDIEVRARPDAKCKKRAKKGGKRKPRRCHQPV